MPVAKGKLLLFGEHAAVYGYPALGIPLSLEIRVEVKPSLKTKWITPPLTEAERGLLYNLSLPYPAEVTVTSQIPIGVGFGSSAALCVALARALVSEDKVWEQAHEFEKVFHKRPSGIDTAISFHETPCFFQKGKVTPLEDFSQPLVVGALERTSNTATLIERIRQNPEAPHHLKALGEIAEEACRSKEWAELIDQAQEHLTALDLSTPEMDFLLKRGKQLGASGGKLSGAGGGGAYFFILPTFDEAEALVERLTQETKISHKVKPQLLTPIQLEIKS